jgi:tetratricopeptide (TPR) repeat protein
MPSPAKKKEPDAHERAMLITLYSQGHLADAEAMARTMAGSYPKHVLGWKVLGACLKKQGRTAEALPPMQKAAVLSPNDHEAINNLGVTLHELGKLEQAVGCFKEALRLKPDYADAHGNLGDALRQQGKLEAALQSYQRKLALVPGDASTLHHVDALSGRRISTPTSQARCATTSRNVSRNGSARSHLARKLPGACWTWAAAPALSVRPCPPLASSWSAWTWPRPCWSAPASVNAISASSRPISSA